MKQLNWICKKYDELSLNELYEILRLRIEIFVIEQNCHYQDLDRKDQLAYHLMAFDGDCLVGCTRLFDRDVYFEGYTAIGRVVLKQSYRKEGTGKLLMHRSVQNCLELFGNHPIKIGAQKYLNRFYTGLGFEDTGIEFEEDGIPHSYMIRSNSLPA